LTRFVSGTKLKPKRVLELRGRRGRVIYLPEMVLAKEKERKVGHRSKNNLKQREDVCKDVNP